MVCRVFPTRSPGVRKAEETVSSVPSKITRCYLSVTISASRLPTLTFAESPLPRDLVDPIRHGTVPSHREPAHPTKTLSAERRARYVLPLSTRIINTLISYPLATR